MYIIADIFIIIVLFNLIFSVKSVKVTKPIFFLNQVLFKAKQAILSDNARNTHFAPRPLIEKKCLGG
jgi:hypothetical protein